MPAVPGALFKTLHLLSVWRATPHRNKHPGFHESPTLIDPANPRHQKVALSLMVLEDGLSAHYAAFSGAARAVKFFVRDNEVPDTPRSFL